MADDAGSHGNETCVPPFNRGVIFVSQVWRFGQKDHMAMHSSMVVRYSFLDEDGFPCLARLHGFHTVLDDLVFP
jgi:hypothetical protein